MLLRQEILTGLEGEPALGDTRLACQTIAEAILLNAGIERFWGTTARTVHTVQTSQTQEQLSYLLAATIFPEDRRFMSAGASGDIVDFVEQAQRQNRGTARNIGHAPGDAAIIAGLGLIGNEVRKLECVLPGVMHFAVPNLLPASALVLDHDIERAGLLIETNAIVLGERIRGTTVPEHITLVGSRIPDFDARPRFQ